MYALLFERPIALSICWIAVQIVLTWIWSARRDRMSARLAVAGLLAFPVLLALSIVVVTPSEQIIAVCHRLARAVDDGDMPTIGAHLAPEFETAGLDRNAFLETVGRKLTDVRIDAARLRSFDVVFPDVDTGVATFRASCRVRTARMYGAIPSRWRLTFRRDADTWLVTKIESLPVPPLNVSRMRQWLR